MSAQAPTWIWDTTHSLYYSPEMGSYAYTDAEGGWHYLPASSLASSSTATALTGAEGDKEDGEIEDDVGWGGLMEPEELDRALKTKSKSKGNAGSSSNPNSKTEYTEKHPAYANPYPTASPSPPAETPNHLLRLVVLSSPSLTDGHVAIIDTREGGIQLGRDRCEKGGHPRVRVKEMEVSKSHAVIYWGSGGDGDEGWWVVDLGTFKASLQIRRLMSRIDTWNICRKTRRTENRLKTSTVDSQNFIPPLFAHTPLNSFNRSDNIRDPQPRTVAMRRMSTRSFQ